MGKKSAAPAPPDPIKTGAAQTGTNIGTAVANAGLNQVDQITPDGSLSYSQTGNTAWTDPVSGKTYQIPKFLATQTLSPAQQALKAQTDGAELNFATLANNQSGKLGTLMSQPFNYDTNDHEKWALNLYDKLNGQKEADSIEATRNRLVNQGFREGTAGWESAMKAAQGGNMDARNRFLLDSENTGFSQAQATRNQATNEIAALLTGSQVSQPNFVSTPQQNIATTDYAGLTQQDYQNRLSAWQQKQAQNGAMMGGLFGLGSNAIMAFSDRRLKENIRKIGKTHDGQPLYFYTYKGDTEPRIGLMAQDVMARDPGAVAMHPSGFLMVDYDRALGGA
jgi:hypothetical protein